MRIGVFSDDAAGMAVALLVARGLANIHQGVDLIVEDGADHAYVAGSEVPCLRIARTSRDAVELGVQSPVRHGRHLVAARPLDALGGVGETVPFDAVITVGWDHPSSARALRAARYTVGVGRLPAPDTPLPVPPAWFLPCSHQVDLWTKATLASTGAVKLPFATRTIPFMVPRLGPDGVAELARMDAQPPVLRTAVLLASIVTCD